MITDANLTLSGSYAGGVWTAQPAFASGATIKSTNVIDLGSLTPTQGQDYGAGKQLIMLVSIIAAFTGGTTVEFQIVQSDDAAASVNVEVVARSATLAVALLTAGAYVPVMWDRAAPYNPRRFISAAYVNVGVNTTGSVVSQIIETMDDAKFLGAGAYKSGFVVL